MNTIALHNYEIEVAGSMLELARRSFNIFPQFMCTWISFNNIYTTVWYKCREMQLPDPTLTTPVLCSHKPTLMLTAKLTKQERTLLDHAFAHFSDDVKHELVLHPSTAFFAHRSPRFQNGEVYVDNVGRHANGVVNIGRSTKYDIECSTISIPEYELYVANQDGTQLRDLVSLQVLNVVYTVRNNIFHGGKSANDDKDRKVVDKALPLLELIVRDFWADVNAWPS
jgi:hypothetical protein